MTPQSVVLERAARSVGSVPSHAETRVIDVENPCTDRSMRCLYAQGPPAAGLGIGRWRMKY